MDFVVDYFVSIVYTVWVCGEGRTMKKLSKQRMRSQISRGASFVEIYLTAIILIGVIFFSFDIVAELVDVARTFPHYELSIHDFLSHVLALIIAIEFIKMLAKHTPGSAIEVLLFAIARNIIINEGSMLDSLIGVGAIAILFAVRYYFSNSTSIDDVNGSVVSGGMTMKEFNNLFKMDIDISRGYTVAGAIYNIAKADKEDISPGYVVEIENRKFEVYSMDDNLIKQVKIFDKIG